MGLGKLKTYCERLGPMYRIEIRDGVESIVREIGTDYEFEVTGFFSNRRHPIAVNIWRLRPHIERIATYSGIGSVEDLAAVLGYLDFNLRNLRDQIEVEREVPTQ